MATITPPAAVVPFIDIKTGCLTPEGYLLVLQIIRKLNTL